MTYRIACIGEPLAEISYGPDGFKIGFGGDSLSTAIYCSRMSFEKDIEVQYVTAVGADAASYAVLDFMAEEAIPDRFVRQDPDRQLGLYSIQNDASGERSFHYWRDTSAARTLFSFDDALEFQAIEQADLIYLSGISLAILSDAARDRLFNALELRRNAGGVVALDSNYRSALWDSRHLAQTETARFWSVTDIALPTFEDEAALFGDADARATVARLKAIGVANGAVKCGANGPVPINDMAENSQYPAAERVRDTTGAGDSFNGAYLAAYAQGRPEAECLRSGHALASRVVGEVGAILPRTRQPD